jgi:flagellin-like hook-associated protein FlgL
LLIDEWQEAEVVFDYVRRRADEATINGEYILTGSATPNFLSNRKKHQHSGAGRIKQITMSTLTYYEIFKPSETISISKIDSFTPGLKSDLSLEDLIKFCIKGG